MVRQSVLVAMTTRGAKKVKETKAPAKNVPKKQTVTKSKTAVNLDSVLKRADDTDKRLDNLGGDVSELKAMMSSLVDTLKPSSAQGDGDSLADIAEEGSSDEEDAPVSPPGPKRRRKAVARPASQQAAALGSSLRDRVQHLPLFEDLQADMSMDHDGYHVNDHDRNAAGCHGKPRLVSGSVRTADLRVPTKFIAWPHEEGVYVEGGLPPKFEDLTVEQFVQGFIGTAITAPKSELMPRLQFLESLMADVQLRDWSRAKGFYRVWMQLIEQGRADWSDSKDKLDVLKMRHLYLAPSPKAVNKNSSPSAKAGAAKGRGKSSGGSNTATRGKRVCMAFNSDKGCDNKDSHGIFQHRCAYCAKRTGFYFKHSATECERKKEDRA